MTTTTEALVTTIATQDKRALLHASGGISFHLHESQGAIRAHRRGENTSSGFDESHTIFTDTRLLDYGPGSGEGLDKYACFHMEYGSPMLLSVVNRIRPGDTLLVEWVRSNDNPLYKEIGWHRDEVRLAIGHPNRKAETYLIEARVGPDNSARMVRRVR